MVDFPEFMNHPANRIASSSEATPGVEGYVFEWSRWKPTSLLDLPRDSSVCGPHTRL
jgi:hypothetical protein